MCDQDGVITRVIFTSEVPEYYRFLSLRARNVLVALYKKHVSPNVKEADLFSGSQYDPNNVWNLRGAMHMIQRFNTLGAAVTLVAQASVQRVRNGLPLANASDLIECGINADRDRNSDPLIVTDVNALARAKANISFADPVGLYIDRLRTVGWTTPDGSDPATFWRVTRGRKGSAVRAVFEVPPSKPFTIGDIEINDRPITSPSQIAEFVDVRVTGIAFGKNATKPKPCGGGGLLAGAEPEVTLEDITRAMALTRG
jgi:hypothetical protein